MNIKGYYSLCFDEMAIKQQILFDKISKDFVGKEDFGRISEVTPVGLAKSALFGYATEINGSKGFPVGYILTDGLKSEVMADFVRCCVSRVKKSNGIVVSVSFDGHPSNFKALKSLGACFDISSENFQPYFELHENSGSESRHYTVPDPSHMLKLARNTIATCGKLVNCDGEV